MRARLRTLTLVAGAGAAIVLVLLVIAAATGAAAVAVIAGVLGLIGIVAGCIVLPRILESFTAATDRLSTRAKNLEARTGTLAERADAGEARTGTLEDFAASIDGKADELGGRLGTLDAQAQVLERRADQQHERIGRTVRTVGTVSAREKGTRALLDSVDERLTGTRGDLDQLSGRLDAQEATAERSRKDVQILRSRVPAGFLDPVEKQLMDLRATSREALRSTFESAVQLGRDPREVISERLAHRLFKDYLDREEFLRLRPLIENFDVLEKQSLTTLRAVYRFFRSSGYWDLAALAVAQVHAKSKRENDALAVAKIEHEIELFSRPALVRPTLPPGDAYDPSGPILHMVGRVLPETQTGYTLRTQYTALAQARKGLPVAIVGQAGITENAVESVEHYKFQGIDYYLLPGPARNTMLIDEWLARNMLELAELVRELKPSILHAQSDFFNALIIDVVGKAYGIPTVYESRGFWEESWLSRTITANQWGEKAESLFSMYGLPAAYTLRKHAEEVARLQPDHVFTLAEVMRDHILTSADGLIPGDGVSIVPNAVEAENFPVQAPNDDLKREIGIPDDAVVIGYISSIVEYEGIDTLLDAYHMARAHTGRSICLLLVGDGDYLPTLKAHAESQGIQDVFFTGRVPHEQVLDYYGLIDLFVVPRKASQVSDLVTPLKPFEAFSTGRAVVLSDVGALKEIARQSDAVELFRAGDAEDLARRIAALVDDPERRADLSRRAARWVRNHRSWDGNVNEYYRVYKKLGFAGEDNLLVESELALDDRGINPGELLESLRSATAPGLKGWFTIQDIRQSGASILEDGWRFASFEPVKVASIEDWAHYGSEHRSWGFHLHAWEFMDPLLRAFDETRDEHWLREGVRIALGWIAIHRGADDESDPMAWYDMSQSLRTPRLFSLLRRAAEIDSMRDEAVILAEAFAWHLDELHKPRAYNPNNNHGFYTAVSQVHAAKYGWMFPDAEATAVEGRQRLAEMATSQFARDGVHLEHSPDYHRMLLNSFELAVNDGLIEDEDVKGRIHRAAHVLGWMIQPDGALVQFGDSPETRIVKPDAVSIDPATQFLLSDGAQGTPETKELAAYRDGGYAFVRSPQPKGPGELAKSGYLAFSAAFHSRAHKHADDLNVVWFDRGQQILTDGGRFGYGELLAADSPQRAEGFYYAAPERQYVEGTMAHNTLMMDGVDQERRSRTPYGSGLGECTEADGVFDLSARVHHADYIHRRRVVYRPGEELLLKDSVFSQSAETREGILWLNVSGHFELEDNSEEGLVFVSESGDEPTRLTIIGQGRLLEPVRGQENPLRGWRSRQDRSLEPTWSIGFAFSIDTRASVDTTLRLS